MSSDSADPLVLRGAGRRYGSSGCPSAIATAARRLCGTTGTPMLRRRSSSRLLPPYVSGCSIPTIRACSARIPVAWTSTRPHATTAPATKSGVPGRRHQRARVMTRINPRGRSLRWREGRVMLTRATRRPQLRSRPSHPAVERPQRSLQRCDLGKPGRLGTGSTVGRQCLIPLTTGSAPEPRRRLGAQRGRRSLDGQLPRCGAVVDVSVRRVPDRNRRSGPPADRLVVRVLASTEMSSNRTQCPGGHDDRDGADPRSP